MAFLLPDELATQLQKLHKCHHQLEVVNESLRSRPFSSRLQTQFNGQVRQSQQLMNKLAVSIESYARDCHEHNSCQVPLVGQAQQNAGLILGFSSLCHRIEKEWRVGAKLIASQRQQQQAQQQEQQQHERLVRMERFQRDQLRQRAIAKAPKHAPPPPPAWAKDAHDGSHDSSHESDERERKINKKIVEKREDYWASNATHDAKLEPVVGSDWNQEIDKLMENIGKMENIDCGGVDCEQTEQNEQLDQLDLYALPPMKARGQKGIKGMEEGVEESIAEINEKLQDLLELTKELDEMVQQQDEALQEIESKMEVVNEEVLEGASRINSIRKSPATYAVLGGLGAMAVGGPVLMLGVGLKAAIGGSIGFGAIGAFASGTYAGVSNKKLEKQGETLHDIADECNEDRQERKDAQDLKDLRDLKDSKEAMEKEAKKRLKQRFMDSEEGESLLTREMIEEAGLKPVDDNGNEWGVNGFDGLKQRMRKVSFPVVAKSGVKRRRTDCYDNQSDDEIETWNPRSTF